MDHNHPLWDVWADGGRTPMATELTLEEAIEVMGESPSTRYINCSACGAPHIPEA